jgi:predicted DNA-binding protein
MARRTKRFMISMSPDARAALGRLSEATGKPMVTLVGELLDEAVPMLNALADAAMSVREKKADAYATVAAAMADAQVRAAQVSLDFHRGAQRSLSKGKRKGAAR